jgi:hypothetical protein
MCISFPFFCAIARNRHGNIVLQMSISFTFSCDIFLDPPASFVLPMFISFPFFCVIAQNRPGSIVPQMYISFTYSVTFRISLAVLCAMDMHFFHLLCARHVPVSYLRFSYSSTMLPSYCAASLQCYTHTMLQRRFYDATLLQCYDRFAQDNLDVKKVQRICE